MKKSFTAVISPHKFLPSLIDSPSEFESHWNNNRPWVFSNFSHIAYFNENDIHTFMNSLGAKSTRYYDKNGAQAFLAIFDNMSILTFRGTQPIENTGKHHHKLGFIKKFRIKHFLQFPQTVDPLTLIYLNNDILADLKFVPVAFGGSVNTNVHRGFLGEIDKLWSDISQDIELLVGTTPIWVTGHSLGGAMATLAGMRYPFEAVTTFGEPRVGINIHDAFIAKNHIRYVNGDDPVTKLPPERPFGYDHHGDLNQINNHNNESNLLYDHSIIYYSENIKQHNRQTRHL